MCFESLHATMHKRLVSHCILLREYLDIDNIHGVNAWKQMVSGIEQGSIGFNTLFKNLEFEDTRLLEFEYIDILRRIDRCTELSEKGKYSKKDLTLRNVCERNYELLKQRKIAISAGRSVHVYLQQLEQIQATGDDESEIKDKIIEEVNMSKAAGLQILLLSNIWIHDAELENLTSSSIRQSGQAKKSILVKAFNRLLGMTLTQQVKNFNLNGNLIQIN